MRRRLKVSEDWPEGVLRAVSPGNGGIKKEGKAGRSGHFPERKVRVTYVQGADKTLFI